MASILKDFPHHSLQLNPNVLSIHVLEIDAFLFALESYIHNFECTATQATVLKKYIDRLAPYLELHQKEIQKFTHLPMSERRLILQAFYGSPYGTDVQKG